MYCKNCGCKLAEDSIFCSKCGTHKDSMDTYLYCEKCGAIRKNIAAKDDDMNLIIQLSANPVSYE